MTFLKTGIPQPMKRFAPQISSLLLVFALIWGIFNVDVKNTTPVKKDPWWGRDKAMHLSASFIVASLLRSPILNHPMSRERAFICAISMGFAKEAWDLFIKKEKFSLKDLAFDFAGSFVGSI